MARRSRKEPLDPPDDEPAPRPAPKRDDGPTLDERIALDCAALVDELALWGVVLDRGSLPRPSRALLAALALRVGQERARGEAPPCFDLHAYDATEPACLLCDCRSRCGNPGAAPPDALLSTIPAKQRVKPWPCACGGLYSEPIFEAETGALGDFACASCGASYMAAMQWSRPAPAIRTVSDAEVMRYVKR